MIHPTLLSIMVDKSIRRRHEHEAEARDQRPFIEMDMMEAAQAEKDRICALLLMQIPGLETRESHDGGPGLKSLIHELIDVIRK